ncbi:hypothetical protein HRbin34_00274 [bacterium HR34]|nr:hypothetical protein HRbin34_00274 [bacterium HR34]
MNALRNILNHTLKIHISPFLEALEESSYTDWNTYNIPENPPEGSTLPKLSLKVPKDYIFSYGGIQEQRYGPFYSKYILYSICEPNFCNDKYYYSEKLYIRFILELKSDNNICDKNIYKTQEYFSFTNKNGVRLFSVILETIKGTSYDILLCNNEGYEGIVQINMPAVDAGVSLDVVKTYFKILKVQ